MISKNLISLNCRVYTQVVCFTREKFFYKVCLTRGNNLFFSFGLSKTYFLRLKNSVLIYIRFPSSIKKPFKTETQFNFFIYLKFRSI